MLHITCIVQDVTRATFRFADDAWDFCERQKEYPVYIVCNDRTGNREAWDTRFRDRDTFKAWVSGVVQ